jgi:integrase
MARKRNQRERSPRGLGSIVADGSRWKAAVGVSVEGETKRRRAVKRFDSRTEAAKWIAEMSGNRARGIVTAPSTSIADFLNDWLEGPNVTRLKPATIRQYRQIVAVYIIPLLGNTPLSTLTPKKCSAAWAKLAKPGAVPPAKSGRSRVDEKLSPHTVATAQRVLRAALTTAVRDGLIPSNPAALSVLPYQKGALRPSHKALSEEELKALLTECMNHRTGSLVAFAVATGARVGELLALSLDDVDLDNRRMRIHRNLGKQVDGTFRIVEGTKTDVERTVPLGNAAIEALTAERTQRNAERLAAGTAWADNRLVFASPLGTPRDHRNTTRAFHGLLDAAGIGRRGFHSLRHSAATILLTQGLGITATSRVLGHSQQATTANLYVATQERLTAPAADAIDQAFNRSRNLS